jgi:multiple sugar transport system permease protein
VTDYAPPIEGAAETPVAPTPAAGTVTERAREERRLGWYLCAPAVFVMLAVTAYPLGYSVWLSLQRYDLRVPGAHAFVGLRNYLTVLTASVWWQDFLTTVIITVFSVAVELLIGMGLALFMHRAIFGRRTVRTSILIPYGIITVVAAFAWQYAFTPDLGFINTWFNSHRAWLTQRGSSFLVITLTEVWKTTPFMSLLLLAGLAIVPEELQEAAKVDGATAWQRFYKVTLPTMKGAVLVALLFRTLDAFRIFDTVFIQTRGANNTETVSILGYNQLINRVNLGVGSAVSVLLFVAVILIAVLFVKGFNADLGQVRGER